jgi:hypothetical protein
LLGCCLPRSEVIKLCGEITIDHWTPCRIGVMPGLPSLCPKLPASNCQSDRLRQAECVPTRG